MSNHIKTMPNPYRFIFAYDAQEARDLMKQEGWAPQECFVIDEWNLPHGVRDFEVFLTQNVGKRPIGQLDFINDFFKKCGNVKYTYTMVQPSVTQSHRTYGFGPTGGRTTQAAQQTYQSASAKIQAAMEEDLAIARTLDYYRNVYTNPPTHQNNPHSGNSRAWLMWEMKNNRSGPVAREYNAILSAIRSQSMGSQPQQQAGPTPWSQQAQTGQTHTAGGKVAIKAKIWWDDAAGGYVLSSTYAEAFIKALKATIPDSDRSYDPNTKFWYFHEKYGEGIRGLAQTIFGMASVSFVGKEATNQAKAYGQQKASQQNAYLNPTSGGTTEDAVVAFFNLVPYEAAKKCYLTAAQVLHPDKNQGDGTKMSKLNELWTRIEKEFFKR